jgi:hypothetical protein
MLGFIYVYRLNVFHFSQIGTDTVTEFMFVTIYFHCVISEDENVSWQDETDVTNLKCVKFSWNECSLPLILLHLIIYIFTLFVNIWETRNYLIQVIYNSQFLIHSCQWPHMLTWWGHDILQVKSVRQREVLYCLHESGSVSAKFRRRQLAFIGSPLDVPAGSVCSLGKFFARKLHVDQWFVSLVLRKIHIQNMLRFLYNYKLIPPPFCLLDADLGENSHLTFG